MWQAPAYIGARTGPDSRAGRDRGGSDVGTEAARAVRTRYRTRYAETADDLRACQRLRYLAFRAGRGLAAEPEGVDSDDFDPLCKHVMVEEVGSGQLVCCFRMMPLENGREISKTYSAQWYELSKLETFPGRMVEMGRFCVHPEWRDPAILRLAWVEMSRYIDEHGVELLFGCSSFHGVDAESYMDAFALLREKHLAPKRWLPRVKAPRVFRFGKLLRFRKPDLRLAMLRMPPLLRTYLVMGGWVSDHAVIDNDLNTLHVFTGVEIGRVPERRARVMRRAGA